MRRARFALVGLAVLVAGCGPDESESETTTAFVPPPPPAPEVVEVPDDLEPFPEADSLAPDSALAETTALPEEGPSMPPPTFEPFLRDFKEALQTGDAERFAAPALSASDLALVLDDDAFRQRVLEAGPDRYRRDGMRREVYVVVGYDMDGNVVPEDEAETESGLGLVFDVVEGAYKLVRVEPAG